MEDPTHPVYLWAITGTFHVTYFALIGGISLLANAALIFAIIASKSSEIGSYRFLLLCFAMADIFTSVMHVVALPHLHMTSTGYWYLPRNDGIFWSKGGITAIVFTFIYIASYYQTFLILAYHFVYRVRALMRSRSRFDTWHIATWIALGLAVYTLYMGALFGVSLYTLMPSDYSRSIAPKYFVDLYGVDVSDPDVGFLHVTLKRLDTDGKLQWHVPTLIALFVAGTMFFGTAAVIIACIFLINKSMRTLQFAAKTRQLQRKLYKVLLIQTAIPCIFSYTPLAIMLFLPLTGADLGSFGTILVMITAVFPAIDGLLVVLMIPLFRRTIYRYFHIAIESKMTFYLANSTKVSTETEMKAWSTSRT